MKTLFLAALVAVVATTSSAASLIYTGTRTIGTGSVSLSITTDGTIGVLSDSNVLDWNIAMLEGSDSFSLFGPLSGNNSGLSISGAALSATATDLSFDFSAGSGYALFQAPNINSGQTFYCVQVLGCFDFVQPGEAMDPRMNFSFTSTPQSGSVILASTGGESGVPEPATWSTLAAGLAFLAVRRARNR
ncbi:MAG: PEP-CTERM sorting domain-containing protein [Acidobacteriota bacterium]